MARTLCLWRSLPLEKSCIGWMTTGTWGTLLKGKPLPSLALPDKLTSHTSSSQRNLSVPATNRLSNWTDRSLRLLRQLHLLRLRIRTYRTTWHCQSEHSQCFSRTSRSYHVRNDQGRIIQTYIIEAHEHLEDISNQTSVSMIVWIVFSIVHISIIAFFSYTFHYLYNICTTISTVLKLKTCKALYTFISTFLSNHILNTPQIQSQPK